MQMTKNIRFKAQPTLRHLKSINLPTANFLNESQIPLNEDEGTAKPTLRAQMFSEVGQNNQSFTMDHKPISIDHNPSMLNERTEERRRGEECRGTGGGSWEARAATTKARTTHAHMQ